MILGDIFFLIFKSRGYDISYCLKLNINYLEVKHFKYNFEIYFSPFIFSLLSQPCTRKFNISYLYFILFYFQADTLLEMRFGKKLPAYPTKTAFLLFALIIQSS